MRRATIDQLSFSLRASGLRLQRSLRDRRQAPPKLTRVTARDDLATGWSLICGQSVTPLWTAGSPEEWQLTAGKVQNLRQAVGRLHGLILPAGEVFSFWRHVERPTRSHGYVAGRELREGCLVASIGGGLCQLSNALYAAALGAGCEIIERHRHSRIIPGSLAEVGLDATIFWNYVDLRFRAATDLVIDARLTTTDLVLTLRGRPPAQPVISAAAAEPTCAQNHKIANRVPGDCLTCGETSCVYIIRQRGTAGHTAWLLDEAWPEFDHWQQHNRTDGDRYFLPLDGRRWKRPGYAWALPPDRRATTAPWLTWRHGRQIRAAGSQGACLQQALMQRDLALAAFYHRYLLPEADRLVISLNLLPHLWRLGTLGGRRFQVLMTRPPMASLQRALDAAAALHPESPTLADYRAPNWLLAAEEAALGAADRLITPHAGSAAQLAASYPGHLEEIPWIAPHRQRAPGAETDNPLPHPRPRVLFAASALARKGAYEMRQAAGDLPITLRVLGRARESSNFWTGLDIERPLPGTDPLAGVACVVLPAFVEHQPRLLLRALEQNIPVICSPACGLGARTNAILVEAGDGPGLALALADALGLETNAPLPRLKQRIAE